MGAAGCWPYGVNAPSFRAASLRAGEGRAMRGGNGGRVPDVIRDGKACAILRADSLSSEIHAHVDVAEIVGVDLFRGGHQ